MKISENETASKIFNYLESEIYVNAVPIHMVRYVYTDERTRNLA